ncbi:MAG: leucine-rich repeat protein [Treponema sp.]|jgi:hypothetical protein|nr:leucine-rich repeat protein [Treponema sp.]
MTFMKKSNGFWRFAPMGALACGLALVVAATALVSCDNGSTGGGNDELTPTVTGVTVTPATVSVVKGKTQQFNATVAGENSPAQTVTWTVEGTGKTGTAMDGATLTVASDETAATLTVRATSKVDTSKSGTATVTVVTPNTNEIKLVTITGTAKVGQVLTAEAKDATESGATVTDATFQWKSASASDGEYTDISGATSATYTLVAADQGKYIKVEAKNAKTTTAVLSTDAKGPVAAASSGGEGELEEMTAQEFIDRLLGEFAEMFEFPFTLQGLAELFAEFDDEDAPTVEDLQKVICKSASGEQFGVVEEITADTTVYVDPSIFDDDDDDNGGESEDGAPSATPTASTTTVAKTSLTQASVDFTLTNATEITGTWKVYAGSDGDTLASGVSAAITTWPTLRLTHTSDIPAATYYVSVTEDGKSESGRLALTVELAPSATPTASTTTVAKTSLTQATVDFTLTNETAITGTWKVYAGSDGDTLASGVSAAITTWPTLRLTHTSNIPAATYYVSVTEDGKSESVRLALTVELAPSATPTASTTTVAKTAATQASVDFTLTNETEITGTWKVYAGNTGDTLASGVSAAITTWPTLSLTHTDNIPAATYYVSVTEDGKSESVRLALTVGEYVITAVESGEFTSAVGHNTLTITLTGGTFVTSPTLSQFSISTAGSGGFANLTGGTVTRTSDTVVTITGLTAVTTVGSGQKITVAAAAQATQATSVSVTASTGLTSVEALNAFLNTLSGTSAAAPITVHLELNISDTWGDINTAVQNAEQYVVLDLSACTATSNTIYGSFSPSGNNMTVIKNNSYIKGIVLPDTLTIIGDYVFYNCFGLTSVTIPNSVTSIGNYAFYNCFGLTSVTIGDSVTSIGTSAFDLCRRLTSVTIPASVTSIGSSAFDYCTGLTSITVAENNTTYSSVDGVLFNKNKTMLIQYPAGKTGAYTIPSSVTSIGDYAFSGCTGLTSVTIGASVTSIGNYAFYVCTGLTSVTIPGSVTSIGSQAFRDCNGLTSVTFEGSAIEDNNFGTYAFPEGANGIGNSLKEAYLGEGSGGAGTYTRASGGSTWTKQQ